MNWYFRERSPKGSWSEIDLKARFTCGGEEKEIDGFYAGKGRYIIRYLPQRTGMVSWRTEGLFCESGQEECVPCEDRIHHGVVKPAGTALSYEDGTSCRPFGTTVYAMMHQPKELIAQTIRSIIRSPFDKVRTCVFPKHYVFNENEPELFAFERRRTEPLTITVHASPSGTLLRKCWRTLGDHGVEVDLILFSPL